MQYGKSASKIVLGAASLGVTSAAAVSAALGQQVASNDTPKSKEIETVVVTGRKTDLDVLPKTILNTPQSINVVPAEVIQQQGVNNLQDALRNVPGITLNAGEGGTHGDLVNLRGFSAGDDYYMDGLRDTGLYDRDTFDYDSIEVLKGPASTLFGRGSTGGVINQVTKAPVLYPVENFSVTGGTNSEIRATADMNYVLGDDMAMRINLMGQDSSVVDRPYARNERWGAAPSFAWGIDTDTSFTLKYLHQQEDNLPDYGVPFLFGKPAPVARDTYYGLPADDRFKTDVDVVTGRFEHTFNDMFSFSDTARYGSYWFDSRQTAAIYGSANCFTDSSSPYYYAGATLCSSVSAPVPVTLNNPLYPVEGTPVNDIWVLRDRPSSSGVITTMMNNADVTAKFATGSIAHTFVGGVEADSEIASLVRFTNQDDEILPTPLLDPDPNEAFANLHQTSVRQTPVTSTKTLGVYLNDTIDFSPQWTLTAAVRYDHFSADYDQPLGTPSHFSHVDNIFSPRAALVYKPTENSSLYVSYGTSFNPSAEALSLAASNQDLGPEKDRTFEVGGKTTVLDGMLSLTAALFNTEMTNARISDPTNPNLQTLAGTERVNGFELDAQGRITENWELIAGYTYLDPTAVGLAGVGVHGPIPNTAHNQANLWTTYDFESGLRLGGGLNYMSRVSAGTDNATVPGTIIVAHVPSHVTFDAMAGYKINDQLDIQINGYNLANEYYYVNSYFTRPGENHTVPAAGRTFLLTLDASL
ncbi:MAG TPA: TonB-dependent siderophore receptor [Rhizomicrobium sp.]|nr:TonB-dependent siderophore receptor [Rhizomicrobium sp.]